MKDLAPVGFEPTQLARCQLVTGEHQGAKVVERYAHALEALGQRRAERADRANAARLRSHGVERVVEQALAIGGSVSGLPSGDQRERLVRSQLVALDRSDDVVLAVVRQSTERVCDARSDPTGGELLLARGRELGSQHEPAGHPPLLATQCCGDGCDRPSVRAQRLHDTRLVHRGGRARRGIRQHQCDFGLGEVARRLDEHRHRLGALGSPARQALEAVDDLEALVDPHDADRQIGERDGCRRAATMAAAQGLQAGRKIVDSDRADRGHRVNRVRCHAHARLCPARRDQPVDRQHVVER